MERKIPLEVKIEIEGTAKDEVHHERLNPREVAAQVQVDVEGVDKHGELGR